MTARWPRWTPSKLPIATTDPLGIAAAGVVSRITVKPGAMLGILRKSRMGRDGDLGRSMKSSGPEPVPARAGICRFSGNRLTGCLRADASAGCVDCGRFALAQAWLMVCGVERCGGSQEWRLIFLCRFLVWIITTP